MTAKDKAALKALEALAWIRKKLDLPEDAGMFTAGGIAGKLHNLCFDAHGFQTYILAYKCDDKQGEIARLTVRAERAEALIAASEEEPADGSEECAACHGSGRVPKGQSQNAIHRMIYFLSEPAPTSEGDNEMTPTENLLADLRALADEMNAPHPRRTVTRKIMARHLRELIARHEKQADPSAPYTLPRPADLIDMDQGDAGVVPDIARPGRTIKVATPAHDEPLPLGLLIPYEPDSPPDPPAPVVTEKYVIRNKAGEYWLRRADGDFAWDKLGDATLCDWDAHPEEEGESFERVIVHISLIVSPPADLSGPDGPVADSADGYKVTQEEHNKEGNHA